MRNFSKGCGRLLMGSSMNISLVVILAVDFCLAPTDLEPLSNIFAPVFFSLSCFSFVFQIMVQCMFDSSSCTAIFFIKQSHLLPSSF